MNKTHKESKIGILYISYDGMLEPLGQSQVVAYLRHLSKNHRIHLISFEKPSDWHNLKERARIASSLKAAGVNWHPLTYHKRPSALATAWDITQGTFTGAFLMLIHRLTIAHARSYVSAVMALALKSIVGARFIFDMRGFWVNERVDGDIWKKDSRLFRVGKWFEQRFLTRADAVVSLTHTAVQDIKSFPYMQGVNQRFAVIPTCVDLDRFQPAPKVSDVQRSHFVLGYVGSAGVWYLFDEAIRSFLALLKLRPDAEFRIVNRHEHEFIRERLLALGVDLSQVSIQSASHHEMTQLIQGMDACVFYIKPVFSKRASAPTKLGELLACGVPCISNAGVGDSEAILNGGGVGVVLKSFTEDTQCAGMQALLELTGDPDISSRCTTVARESFSLEKGVKTYAELYKAMCSTEKI